MFRIRVLTGTLIAFLTTMAAMIASAAVAGAQVAPPPAGDTATQAATITPITAPTQLSSTGSPLWTFVLVAVLTAVVTVAITLLAVQRRRRSQPVLV